MAALTHSEETRLIRQAQEGDQEAMAALVAAHEGMLRRIVGRFPASGPLDTSDLLQEARIGLMVAIRYFETDRGLRLSTIGHREVSKAVAEAAADGHAIPVPGRTLRRYLAAWAGTDDYSEALTSATTGNHPMAPDTFVAIFETLNGGTSFDEPAEEGGRTLHDTVAATEPDTAAADAAHALLNFLPSEERTVLRLAMGFETGEPLTDLEIAERLGMSRATVQRRRVAALEWLEVNSVSTDA